jgi:hypothetical protein
MEAMRNSWTDDRLDDLNRKVDHGFERMEEQFDGVDRRLDRLEDQFERLGDKLDHLLMGLIFAAFAVSGTLIAALAAVLVTANG